MKLKNYAILSTIVFGLYQLINTTTAFSLRTSKSDTEEITRNAKQTDEKTIAANCDWIFDFDSSVRSVTISKATTQPNREVLGTKA